MAFTKPAYAVNNIQSLADQPTESATILKQTFDKTGADSKTYLNSHIDELESTTNGSSGMDNIGITPISGYVATTPQTILEEMATKIISQLPVPDESITNAKLATDIKVGSLALLNTVDKSNLVAAINEHEIQINSLVTLGIEYPVEPKANQIFYKII